MRVYTHGKLEGAERHEWIVVLWTRWVDAKGMVYPRGVQDTRLRIWELVDTQLGVEYASTNNI